MKIKYSIFIILCLSICTPSIAQVEYLPASAHSFSVSLGGGFTGLYGNFQTTIIKYVGKVNLDYNITPFISAGIEGQYGELSAKGYYIDPYNKVGDVSVLNMYNAMDVNARLGLGQFLSHVPQTASIRVVSGIYVGTGIGFINSSVTPTIIKNPEPQDPTLIGFHNSSSEPFIPANIGINIQLPKILGVSNWVLNINGQENLVLGTYADGYHSPEAHSSTDIYAVISAALTFNFGAIRRL